MLKVNLEMMNGIDNIKYLYTNKFWGGVCVSRCLFFMEKLCNVVTLSFARRYSRSDFLK